jgi:hypothetical protein
MSPRLSALLLICMSALATGAAMAQPGGMPRGGSDAGAAQEVLGFREKVRTAVSGRDRQVLQAAYADNFMHLRDSGRVDLKTERIELLLSGESTIETAPEENINVQFYQPGMVAVTGVSPIRERHSTRSARFRWLTVYVKQGDGWKVALSQASRLPPGSR